MKIIDLLNKIANGEEVPKKIQVYQDIFVLDNSNKLYEQETTRTNLLNIYNGNILNYEAKIIEDKKIEKLEHMNSRDYLENRDEYLSTKDIALDIETLRQWINKIIDKLNSMEE